MKQILWMVIIIQVILTLFLSLNNGMYGWDESAYILNGMDIADQTPEDARANYIAHERHPMLSWMIAGSLMIGVPMIGIKLISFTFMLLFGWFIYYLAQKYFSHDIGLIALVAYVTNPVLIVSSAKLMTDVQGALLFSLAAYCYYKGISDPKFFLIGGFVAGIAILMRDMNVLLAPIILVMWYVWRNKVKHMYVLGSGVVTLITLLPYFIDNYVRWGNPLFRILAHIEMVNQNIGYSSFALQKYPISWLFFIPEFIGWPISIFAGIYMYQNWQKMKQNDFLRFLPVLFIVPAIIFLIKQKISARLVLIFFVPILLFGAAEIIKKKKLWVWITAILVINGFIFSSFVIYHNISVTEKDAELFSYLQGIEWGFTYKSNKSPPSVYAWHANKHVEFSQEMGGTDFYIYEQPGLWFWRKEVKQKEGYGIAFENTKYIVYKHMPGIELWPKGAR